MIESLGVNLTIILISFIISAILMFAAWISSRRLQRTRLNQAEIEMLKADIISMIEKVISSISDIPVPRKPMPYTFLIKRRPGFPTLGKWLMGLAWLPFIVVIVFKGVLNLDTKLKSVPLPTPTTTAASTTYTIGYNPTGICFDGTNVWVVGRDTVTKLRASDGSILGNYGVLTNPFSGICFDGTNIWVTNGGNNTEIGSTVTKLRASDGSILGTYTVGQLAFRHLL